jgi:hypothetical protein
MTHSTFKQFLSEEGPAFLKELPRSIVAELAQYKKEMPIATLMRGQKRAVLDQEPIAYIDSMVPDPASDGRGNYVLKLHKFMINKDRPSVSMNDELQVKLDDGFERAYGVKPRKSSMFCVRVSGDGHGIGFARDYGTPCMVMPVNGYKYMWSLEYDDLFFATTPENIPADPTPEQVDKFIKKARYRVNTELDDVPAGHEIMIYESDYYYCLSAWSFTGRVPIDRPADDEGLFQSMLEISKGF